MGKILSLAVTISLLCCFGCDTDDTPGDIPEEYNFEIGDIGPAGGIIFYINPNHGQDGWKYMESAPDYLSSTCWAGANTLLQDYEYKSIGTGLKNTDSIIKGLGELDPWLVAASAAGRCKNYTVSRGGNTYNDWFLPSEGELSEFLFIEKTILKRENFDNKLFWTSTENLFDKANVLRLNYNAMTGERDIQFFLKFKGDGLSV